MTKPTTRFMSTRLTGTRLTGAVLAGVMALGTFLAAGGAHASDERMCAKRDEITALLGDRYDEAPRAMGVSESGDAAFELYLSPTGTWTITMTTSNNLTCVMAAGKHWQQRGTVADAVVGKPPKF